MNNAITLYHIWVNGRDLENKKIPINARIHEEKQFWYSNLDEVIEDYLKVSVNHSDIKETNKKLIDYLVSIFSIDIDIEEFENKFNLKFDINSDIVQVLLHYFINYENFNLLRSRIGKFKLK